MNRTSDAMRRGTFRWSMTGPLGSCHCLNELRDVAMLMLIRSSVEARL
uniref:Uncharacterized protein n=1 Tax=Romanomermis culicivorax TaxID=13658 RepID=A0A915I076_ROMCU